LSKNPGIFIKLFVNVSQMPVYFRLVEVVLFAVLGSQLRAVAGNQVSADQLKMFCDLNSSSEDFTNCFLIILPEV
jgi:hypothetical protein